MRAFAALLDALIYTRSRNDKLVLIADYMQAMPDPDRGWALAALTGGLSFGAVKSAVIRGVRRRGLIRCCSASAAIMWGTAPKRWR